MKRFGKLTSPRIMVLRVRRRFGKLVKKGVSGFGCEGKDPNKA